MRAEVRVFGSEATRPTAVVLSPQVAARAVWVPAFVDLVCDPGFPGFPARETPASLADAATAGGFCELLACPHVDPVVDTPEHLSRTEPLRPPVRLLAAAALTVGLRGVELTEVGLLRQAGARALSDGRVPVADSLVLRNALEYAREFRLPVLLRPADAALDAVGVIHDSPLAARLGLRGNPAATEEIGVARAIALCRATGATVHLTHLGTARAVEQVVAAQREGLPLTASTPARNLVLDELALDDGRYDARLRLHPPLRGRAERAALVDAVRAGVLWVCADHQPRAPEEKDHEFERAVPGSAGLRSAFAACLHATRDLGATVRALSEGPRSLLGLPVGGWALVDPEAPWVPVPARGQAPDALEGHELRGVVLDLAAG